MKKIIAAALTCLLSISSVQAEGEKSHHKVNKIERRISIDTDYYFNTNRAWAGFGKDVLGVYTYGFDMVGSKFTMDGMWKRGGYAFLGLVLSTPLSEAYMTTYHEMGHKTRAYARGYRSYFDKRPNNFIGFFGQKVFEPYSGEGTVTYLSSPFHHTPHKPSYYYTVTNGIRLPTANATIIGSGAGVNNEMRFAGEMSREMHAGRGHIMTIAAYNRGKLSSTRYPLGHTLGNDMGSVVSAYQAKGLNITKKNINDANRLAWLLSGTTYAYYRGVFSYIRDGDPAVKPFYFPGNFSRIRVPDVENYLTTHGISYKIHTGYQIDNDTFIPIAYEFVGKGNTKQEITVGMEKRMHDIPGLRVKGYVLLSEKPGFGGSATYPLLPNLKVSGGVDHLHVRSLEGERNAYSYKNERNTMIWAKLSYCYY